MMEQQIELKQTLEKYARETARLEEALSSLQKQFQELKEKVEILSYMSEGLIFVSMEGVVTLFNPAAAHLTGYVQDTVLYSSYWEFFSDTLFGFSMRKALKNLSSQHHIYLTLNASTEVEVSTTNIAERGILLLLHDRTEQQELERSAQQSDRLKELGEMAATLAHEIRNPLGGIEGFAQLLKRDLETPSHQQMIKAILEGTRTLNHLVTNVLDYARPLKLHFAPSDLVKVVEETIAFEKGPIVFKSTFEQFIVSIDQGRIKLVLLNLIRNAFESKATYVELSLTKEGELKIKDNGEGISKQNLEKIFTPFFTTKAKGTGIGLAEAKVVIQAHNGTLEVESKERGGTTFTLKLPSKHEH